MYESNISHKFLHGQGPEYLTELFTAERSNLRGNPSPAAPFSIWNTCIAGMPRNSMPNKVTESNLLLVITEFNRDVIGCQVYEG